MLKFRYRVDPMFQNSSKIRCKREVKVAADTVVAFECTKFKIWGWTWHEAVCEPDYLQLTVGDEGSRK